MNPIDQKFDHDLDLLDERAHTLLGLVDRISDHRATLKEIIAEWRRPGWTTPAEFFLVDIQLQSLAKQAALLEESIGDLNKAAQMVGR
ncbi:hypothetical protein ACSDQ9_05475 [Aestuariimicrobium soli]|uniref:hypothetical protein n=1 Tax=Aestuariimicrobium soli TaxID=2035834 RepID=UPI003EC09326